MKRPLANALLSFFAALIVFNFFTLKHAAILFGVIAATVIALLFFCRFSKKFSMRSALILLIPILIGGLIYCANLYFRYIPALQLSGSVMRMKATLCEPEKKSGDNYIYIIKAQNLYSSDETSSFKGKIRLISKKPLYLQPFDTFTIQAALTLPPKDMGSGFDSRSYYRSKGIYLNAYPISGTFRFTGREYGFITPYPLYWYAINARKSVIYALDSSLDKTTASLANGILLGDTSQISADVKEDFARSGLSHTLAVSGMNISFLLGVIFTLNKMIRKRRTGKVYAICAAVVFLFMCVVGFSPSVVRAGIMALIVCLAGILYKEPDSLTSLAVAGGVQLLINPFAAHDVSLLLSFFATLGIILFSAPAAGFIKSAANNLQNKLKGPVITVRVLCFSLKWVLTILSLSLGAALFTYPVLILFFKEISIISPLANMLVIPAVFLMFVESVVLLIVTPIAPAAWLFGLIVKYSSEYIFFMTSKLADLPFAYLPAKLSFMAVLAVYPCAVGLLWLFYRHLAPRLLTPALLFACLVMLGFTSHTMLNHAQLIFACVNTGQGDSLVLIRGGHAVVIDCGGPHGKAAGESMLSYLDTKGIKELDAAIVTHFHEDHVSGFTTLFDSISPRTVFYHPFDNSALAREVLDKAKNSGALLTQVPGHTVLNWQGVKIDIVYADTGELLIPGDSQNERALCVRAAYNGKSILMMSDISDYGEAYLLDRYPQLIDADILKVGHHGSNRSSSEHFIEAASPDISVISVGTNSFGHPSNETLNRLAERGSAVFRTDLSKTVEIFIYDSGPCKVALGAA